MRVAREEELDHPNDEDYQAFRKKKNNRINNWNPSLFFQELVELLEYVVDGGTEVFRWPVNRRDLDANMEAAGKCCNC